MEKKKTTRPAAVEKPAAPAPPLAAAATPVPVLSAPAAAPSAPTPVAASAPELPPPVDSAKAPAEPLPPALPLGEMLVIAGKASPEQVHEALKLQQEGDPSRLGEILVEKGAAQTGRRP